MNDTPIFDSNADKAAEAKRRALKQEINDSYAKYAETDGVVTDNRPTPKVWSATVGAGVGSALATIIVWVVNVATGVDVPETVELASGVVLTAGLAFVGGHWKRD